MFSGLPRFPCFLHFRMRIPTFAHFGPFSRIFARSGRRLAAALPRRQKFAIFSLPAAAGRGAAPRRVESYRLYAIRYAPYPALRHALRHGAFSLPRTVRPLPLKENMLAFVLFLPFWIAFLSVSSVCRLPLRFEPLFFEQSGNSEPFVFFPVLPVWPVFCALPFPGFSCSRPDFVLPASAKRPFPHLMTLRKWFSGFSPLRYVILSHFFPCPCWFPCIFSRVFSASLHVPLHFPVQISPKMHKKPPAISQTFFLRFCRRFPVPGMLFSPGASQTIFSFWRGGINTPAW